MSCTCESCRGRPARVEALYAKLADIINAEPCSAGDAMIAVVLAAGALLRQSPLDERPSELSLAVRAMTAAAELDRTAHAVQPGETGAVH